MIQELFVLLFYLASAEEDLLFTERGKACAGNTSKLREIVGLWEVIETLPHCGSIQDDMGHLEATGKGFKSPPPPKEVCEPGRQAQKKGRCLSELGVISGVKTWIWTRHIKGSWG